MILLLQPSECWSYGHHTHFMLQWKWNPELPACQIGKQSTNWDTSFAPENYISSFSLLPTTLHLLSIINFIKHISNKGKANLWGILPHWSIKILLFFCFFSRDQSGNALQFKKVVFQEFTDGSFSQPLYRGELNEHLGLLGPYIRAEVEDNIMVS